MEAAGEDGRQRIWINVNCATCGEPYRLKRSRLRRNACSTCGAITHPSPACRARHQCPTPADPRPGPMARFASWAKSAFRKEP